MTAPVEAKRVSTRFLDRLSLDRQREKSIMEPHKHEMFIDLVCVIAMEFSLCLSAEKVIR